MVRSFRPVVLLLGAKSSPVLPAVDRELHNLDQLFSEHENAIPVFEVKHYPNLTPKLLGQKLNQLAGRVAIIHFAGHSNDCGLKTDTGETVFSNHIADHIASWPSPPTLVFLNGCQNARQAGLFHKAKVPIIIGTHQPIGDEIAVSFARGFYRRLFDTKTVSIHTAFIQSGATVLNIENRSVRSLDLDLDEMSLDADIDVSCAGLDWSPFYLQPECADWTLRELLTRYRPVTDPDGELINPYKGLDAFREQDERWFFGRERISNELVGLMSTNRLFVLYGTSGSGKSSLINAGVIPRLRQHYNDALILLGSPGADPFNALATLLASARFPNSPTDRSIEKLKLFEALQQRKPVLRLADSIQNLLQDLSKPCAFLFFDQFEELFTQSDSKTAEIFLGLLIELVNSEASCTLILTIRADFLTNALSYRFFADELNKWPDRKLSPMQRSELREIIEQPAARQLASIEANLAHELLTDVEKQPGSLPLLQSALSKLWIGRGKNRITLKDYNQFGGLKKVLDVHAETFFKSLSTIEKNSCQIIFLKLVRPGQGNDDTRRRAFINEFNEDADQTVLKKMVDARLIITDSLDKGDTEYVEISHEALIGNWSRLKRWVDANRSDMITHQQISAVALEWKKSNRDETSGWLITGTRLQIAEDWLRDYPERPTLVEEAFIKSSVELRNTALAEEKCKELEKLDLEKQNRQLAEDKAAESERSEQRVKRQSMGLVAALLVTLGLMVVAGVLFMDEKETSTSLQEEILKSNFNLAKALEEKSIAAFEIASASEVRYEERLEQLRKSMLYALEAQRKPLLPDNEAIKNTTLSKLLQINHKRLLPVRFETPRYSYHVEEVTSVSFNHDSSRLLSSSEDGGLALWDVNSGELLHSSHSFLGVSSASFNHDGSIVVSSDRSYENPMGEDIVNIADATNLQFLHELGEHSSRVTPDSFTRSGSLLALASSDNKVKLWDAKKGNLIDTLSIGGKTHLVSINIDGSLLATGSSNNTIKLWSVKNRNLIYEFIGHEGAVRAISFTPNGGILASASSDNTIKLWDTSNGLLLQTLEGHTKPINSISFNHNGSNLVSGAEDGKIKLWDTKKGQILDTSKGHFGSVNSVAFNQDGSRFASGSDDQMVRLWNIDGNQMFQNSDQPSRKVWPMSFNFDGSIWASASYGVIQLWNASTGELLKTFEISEGAGGPVSFSDDGTLLLSGGKEEKLKIWDVNSGSLLHTLSGHADNVSSAIFSHDGALVASGSWDKTVKLWSVRSGSLLHTLKGHDGRVSSISFNHDGSLLVSGSHDKTLKLWDTKTGQLLHSFEEHTGSVYSTAFNPNGSTFVSGSEDKTLKVWNVESYKLLQTLEGHTGSINSLAFNHDGGRLMSGSDNNEVKLWDANNFRLLHNHESGDYMRSLYFQKNGGRFAAGSRFAITRLWDIHNGQLLHELEGHSKAVFAVSFSNSGSLLATGSINGGLKLWDVGSFQLLHTFKGHPDLIDSLAFSFDDKQLASGSGDGTVKLWNVNSGQFSGTLKGHKSRVVSLSFSNNGNLLASGSQDKKIKLWQTSDGQLLHTFEGLTDSINSISLSHDGSRLVSGFWDNTVKVWDVGRRKLLHTFIVPSRVLNSRGVSAVSFSQNGKRLITASDGVIRVWDADSFQLINIINENTNLSDVDSVFFNHDESLLVASSENGGVVEIWDANKLVLLHRLEGSSQEGYKASFNFDKKLFVSGVGDGKLSFGDLAFKEDLIKYDAGIWADALSFLWGMRLEGVEIVPDSPKPNLFQKHNHTITWNDKTEKFHTLLNPPLPNETKWEQVVRWLEDNKAYRKH